MSLDSGFGQGVKLIKENHPQLDPVFLFISPPSFASLKERLTGRGTEVSPFSLVSRLRRRFPSL